MKKTMLILLALTLVLTACAGTQSTPGSTAIPAQDSLPASTQLILGTLRLEGTAQAVSAEQAAELLPLWQVYQELDGSGTAAQAEIDALVRQIQETLSTSQMQAILAISLTQADVMAVMAEQELAQASPQANSGSTVSAGGTQGGPGDGMLPADMGGSDPAMMGGTVPASASASSEVSAQAHAAPDVPSALLDALILLLQSKVG